MVEWFKSPVEKAIGDFMVWSRPVRPEAGRAWELNQQGADAMRTLGTLSQASRMRQAASGTLTDWAMVPAMMDSFEVFSISPQRLIDLYDQLPPALQGMVIKPLELAKVRASGNWQRVFFLMEGENRMVYLVDAYNVVLHQTSLSDTFFERYRTFSRPVPGYIDQQEGFTIIAPAEAFFQAVSRGGGVALNPGDLRWITSLDGRLGSVGITENATGEMWKIGFEIDREGRVYIRYYWIDKTAGEALKEALKSFKRTESARRPL